MPRRSARLSRDTAINSNSNSNISQFGGNGTDHSSGKLRVNSSTPSKLCSTAVRSVQVRKGKPRATENFDEGDYHFNVDDSSNYKSSKMCLMCMFCYVPVWLCDQDLSAYLLDVLFH
jgi:hypothetical protein